MADPITLAAIGSSALSGIIDNLADKAFCLTTQTLWKKLRDGATLPRNADLARAIRRAQLIALRFGVLSYAELPHPTFRNPQGYSPEDITTPLLIWIKNTLAKGEATSADEPSMRKVEADIERAFLHPAPHEGAAAARQNELATLALNWTIAEARTHAPAAHDWPRFESLLREGNAATGGTYPGWWPLFRALLAEEIKTTPRVSTILAEQGIAKLLDLHVDLAAAVTTLQTGFETFIATLGPTLQALRASTEEIATNATKIEAAVTSLDQQFATFTAALRQTIRQEIHTSNQAFLGILPNLGQSTLTAKRLAARPTDLLLARHAIVPFIDHAGLLANLLAWATTPSESRAQGRLYVAPGGFGKTRLGIELLTRLQQRGGWRLSFLSPRNAGAITQAALAQEFNANPAAPTCIIIDYAESQIDQLRKLAEAASLAANATPNGPPIRLLAFARSEAGWWNDLAATQQVFDLAPYREAQTAWPADQRQALFTASRNAFQEQLRAHSLPNRAHSTAPSLANADRALVIAALAFIDASGATSPGASVFESLYQLEREYWRRALGAPATDAPEVTCLARAAAQITLVQGASEAGAETLIAADPRAHKLDSETTISHLRHLYGYSITAPTSETAAPSASPMIGPIEPDLLGEHAAIQILNHESTNAGPGFLSATMRAALGGPPLYSRDPAEILNVLTRATRPEHEKSVPEAARAAIASLTHLLPNLSEPELERLGNSVPFYSVALQELSAAIAHSLVHMAPNAGNEAELADRADRLANLSTRLSNLGRREEALATCQEAVTLCRDLVAQNRDAYLANLAAALNNLSIRFFNLGRRDEAIAASQEGVTLHRGLVTQNRDTSLPNFAAALNNLGTWLSSLGHRDEALATSQEAVTLYSKLVAQNRDTFLPNLASALNNLSNSFSSLGRCVEALASSQEAVTLYRELAGQNRDAFLPNLAVALNNLGIQFSSLGRHDKALPASEEAVTHYRELVAQNRDAFLPDLAMALTNLSNRLSSIGRRAEALAASHEAVTFYRELAAQNRVAVLPDLSGALDNLSIRFSSLGRLAEALSASQEAVNHNRELVAQNRDAFLPDLARALNNLGNRFSSIGRDDEALAASQEAVTLRRELVAQNRDAFLPNLASALNNLGIRFSSLGRRDEALAASQEAVTLYRELAAQNPNAILPELAQSLSVHADALEATGQTTEALHMDEEALTALAPFAERTPQAFMPALESYVRDYLRRCQSLNHPPNPNLPHPVPALLQQLQSQPPNPP